MAAHPARSRRDGRHFLGPRVASDIVAASRVRAGDVVVDVGAGEGALTRALALAGARVLAIERDPMLARRLRRRFAAVAAVEVVEVDALAVALPAVPFRVVANIPFGITTALLRRLLDDPSSRLIAADLVVQRAVANKRVRVPPRNLLSLSWGAWWTFARGRSLPAGVFHPRPAVDAAVLTVRRRTPSLVPAGLRSEFVGLLGSAFQRAGERMPVSLRGVVPVEEVRSALSELGIPQRARPVDLTVEEWVAFFLRVAP